MFLTTDNLDPDRRVKIDGIEKKLLSLLPADYIDFLSKFGSGTYCDEVYISYPDSRNIPLNFSDYTDLWDYNDLYTPDNLLKSIQIGWTANGDIICVTEEKAGNVFVLPRHSTTIQVYKTFFAAVHSFTTETSNGYFDPAFDSKRNQIRLIKPTGVLTDILPIHQDFLAQFDPDFVAHELTQPKYFFKAFGGWVSFDLIYKNSITIKFQGQFTKIALPVINYLHSYEE